MQESREPIDNPLRDLSAEQFQALGGNAVVYVKHMKGDALGNVLPGADFSTEEDYHLVVSADGQPLAQIGLFLPQETGDLVHAGGTRFRTTREPQPMEGGAIFQGFLEGSNVNAVSEITRMIEVQRAYEMGQGFLDAEDGRIRSVTETLGR